MTNSEFVFREALKRAGTSKTACAILANRMSKKTKLAFEFKSLANLVDQDPVDSHLNLVHSLIDQQQTGPVMVDEEVLLEKVFQIIAKNRDNISVIQSCFSLLSLLVRRKENRPLIASHVELILQVAGILPMSGPVTTELLMGIIISDLAVANEVEERVEKLIHQKRNFENDETLQEIAIRDFDIIEGVLLSGSLVRGVGDRIGFSGSKKKAEFDQICPLVEPVLDCIVKFVLAESAAAPGTALDISSTLICLSAILTDLSKLGASFKDGNEFQRIQKKFIQYLVKDIGRKLVGLADKTHVDASSVEATSTSVASAPKGVAEAVMKQVRQWADCVNQASGFITPDVLKMIRDELIVAEETCSVNAKILRSYAYAGLVFLLTEGGHEKKGPIELELIELLANRLQFGVEHLRRSDANLQIEALLVSLHQLMRGAHMDDGDEADEADEADDGDDGDAEMSDQDEDDLDDDLDDESDDVIEGDETDPMDNDEVDEVLVDDHNEEVMDEELVAALNDMEDDDDEDDDENDIDLDEHGNIPEQESSEEGSEEDPYCNPEEESESSEGDEDDDEEDMYGDEWDDENFSYDDVDWEEDDEDEDEEEVDDHGLVMGDGDHEYGDFAMEVGSAAPPTGSPMAGPEPSVPVVPRRPFDEEEARARLSGIISRIPQETPQDTSSESNGSDEDSSEENELSELAGLAGLSLEERLSIQQALGMEDEEDDEWVLPPGQMWQPNRQNELVVEMPRDMDPQQQATLLAGMINNYTGHSGMGNFGHHGNPMAVIPNSRRAVPSVGPLSNFALTFEVPDETRAEELCGDPPNAALTTVAKSCLPILFLRNHYVPMKPAIDRILFQVCLDSMARPVLLESLFGALVKIVAPRSTMWAVADNGVVGEIAATGLFDHNTDELNSPAQARTVGSGRLINTFSYLLTHVPRVRLWFATPSIQETFDGRQASTPERSKKRHSFSARSTPPQEGGYLTASDGEGPLVRAVSSGQISFSRKVSPLSILVKFLTTPFIVASPSHALIVLTCVLGGLQEFPKSAKEKSSHDKALVQAISSESVEILCDFLTETRNRLRHMPEFDKAMHKASLILVALARDLRMRELVRQKLLATAGRLVGEMLVKLGDSADNSVSAAPLARVFKTAREAFATSETYSDFAPAVPNIDQLWAAMDLRLTSHSGLLLGSPSIAQQALQKAENRIETTADDLESPTHKIATLETISKLIPLVEVFLLAHDGKTVIQSFVERHRRPINAMVKSRPSLLNKAFAPLVSHCSHLLDFDNKRTFFRTKLRNDRQTAPPIKLNVRRDDVFRDSYAKLQIRSAAEWRGKLSVSFHGEEGVDAGGLVREWFGILAREIFNPNYALFLPASGRPSTFVMNPASCVNPDHIHYFRFCGRFIGKAVYDNQRIDAYFTRSVYKHMLGKEVTWRDMETTDPEYFKNLNWILENDMSDVDYYSFTVEENEFGKLKVVELLPGGENIRVTESNKQEYVRLVCEHKLTRGFQEQLKAFLQGFHEICPKEIIGTLFDDKELEMLISGLPSIDIADLKKHTDYVHYTESSEQIEWFWKALESFTPDELAWFLQFVTGSTQVPLEGFKGLAGMHGPQRFSIHRIKVEDRLPTAHTCFNQLDLPEYPSYAVLEAKLKQAVREGHSGFGFI